MRFKAPATDGHVEPIASGMIMSFWFWSALQSTPATPMYSLKADAIVGHACHVATTINTARKD
jgi:hypothetical protein